MVELKSHPILHYNHPLVVATIKGGRREAEDYTRLKEEE
jgi:hypothetical protein